MPVFKFLGDFFKKVGIIFKSLAKGANKVWDQYEPELQQAIKDGSGIVETINRYLDKDASFILIALQAEFPNLPVEKIKTILATVAVDLNLADNIIDADPLITIENIAKYLKTRSGNNWAKASGFIAETIALLLAPEGTLYAKVATIMWWVYQTFIKKDKKI